MIFIHVSPRTVRPQQNSEAAIFLRCYFTVNLHASNSTIQKHTSSCTHRSFPYIVYYKTNIIRFHTYVQARAQNVCHQRTKLYKNMLLWYLHTTELVNREQLIRITNTMEQQERPAGIFLKRVAKLFQMFISFQVTMIMDL